MNRISTDPDPLYFTFHRHRLTLFRPPAWTDDDTAEIILCLARALPAIHEVRVIPGIPSGFSFFDPA